LSFSFKARGQRKEKGGHGQKGFRRAARGPKKAGKGRPAKRKAHHRGKVSGSDKA